MFELKVQSKLFNYTVIYRENLVQYQLKWTLNKSESVPRSQIEHIDMQVHFYSTHPPETSNHTNKTPDPYKVVSDLFSYDLEGTTLAKRNPSPCLANCSCTISIVQLIFVDDDT